MFNLSNELHAFLANINSELVVTDVNTSEFKALIKQLTEAITCMQHMDDAETLRDILHDTRSPKLANVIFQHLKEIGVI